MPPSGGNVSASSPSAKAVTVSKAISIANVNRLHKILFFFMPHLSFSVFPIRLHKILFFFMPHLSFFVFPILSRECLTPSAAIAECSQRGVPGNRAATHRELRAVTAQTHAAAMNNSIARSSAAGNGAAGIGILVGHNPSILANRIGRIVGSPGTVLMINDLCGKYPIAVHAIGQRVHRHFHRSAKLTGGCCGFAIVPKDR